MILGKKVAGPHMVVQRVSRRGIFGHFQSSHRGHTFLFQHSLRLVLAQEQTDKRDRSIWTYLSHIPNTNQLKKEKYKAWTKPKHISLLSPYRSKKSRDPQESPLISTCTIIVCIPQEVSVRTQHKLPTGCCMTV